MEKASRVGLFDLRGVIELASVRMQSLCFPNSDQNLHKMKNSFLHTFPGIWVSGVKSYLTMVASDCQRHSLKIKLVPILPVSYLAVT